MKIIPVLIIIIVAAIAAVIAIGVTGGFEPGSTTTHTPTPIPTATSLPAVIMSCEEARDAIQDALEAYNTAHGNWPTMDGEPGDIEWTELVPDFMEAVPANDSKCDWQVNSDPEGDVCVLNRC